MKKTIKQLAFLVICLLIPYVSFGQNAAEDRMQLQMGLSFESVGDYENALKVYLSLHQKNPKNYTYFDSVCRTYINLKRIDELIALVQSRLKADPNNLQYQVKLGDAFIRKGNEEKAHIVWEKLFQSQKKNSSVYRMIANVWMQNRHFDKGIEVYKRGRKQLGNESFFALELAQLHTYRLNYGLAAEEYMNFLQKDPKQLAYVEARLAGFKGDFKTYENVTEVVKKWINKNPDIIQFRKIMISFLISYENYQGAFEQVKQLEGLKQRLALKEKPGMELFRFGRTVISEKQYKLAEESFWIILDDYPKFQSDGQVEYELARTLLLQNKFKDALNLYAKIAKIFPKTNWALEAYMTRGEIFLEQLFLPDSAAAVFSKVQTLFPNHDKRAMSMIKLGNVELARNNPDKANDYYNQALKVPIRNVKMRQEIQVIAELRLAESAFFQKDFESSKKFLQSILKKQIKNLSNVYINDALELLLLIEKNAAEHSKALGEYAEILLLKKQNELQVASARFETILSLYPKAPLVPQALFISAQLKEEHNDFLGAVLTYKKIIARFSKNFLCDLSLWQIGKIYEVELKNIAKAVENYENILLDYPESMLAEQTRKKIRNLEGKS